ncbi:hypothetical protein D3C72_1308910 [compost metagenome]
MGSLSTPERWLSKSVRVIRAAMSAGTPDGGAQSARGASRSTSPRRAMAASDRAVKLLVAEAM